MPFSGGYRRVARHRAPGARFWSEYRGRECRLLVRASSSFMLDAIFCAPLRGACRIASVAGRAVWSLLGLVLHSFARARPVTGVVRRPRLGGAAAQFSSPMRRRSLDAEERSRVSPVELPWPRLHLGPGSAACSQRQCICVLRRGGSVAGHRRVWIFILPESRRRSPLAVLVAKPILLAAADGAAIQSETRRRILSGVLAQLMLQATWVLFTHFRFGWCTRENGFALFCVGLVAAVVQGGMLGTLLRRFGNVRLALTGLATGIVAYVLYGLAPQGWMMYAIIIANFLSFAAGPALQAVVSNAVDPREQGITMGALNSINSIMFVVAPAIGTPLLAQVSHLPSRTARRRPSLSSRCAGCPFWLGAAFATYRLLRLLRAR